MKKLFSRTMLLLCALIAGSGTVWAQTVTFTAGIDKSESTSITKDGITISFSQGVFNRTDNYRCYSGASMKITSNGAAIIQIDFTAESSNPMTKFSGNPDVGAWTDTNTKTQWKGNATEINFGTTSGQARMTKIVVTCAGDVPTITADDTHIAYNATNGIINYTINKPADDGVLTATCPEGWLSLGTVTDSSIPFTVTTNNSTDERTADVTLTYTYDTDKTITKVISVTQGTAVTEYWAKVSLSELTQDDIFVIVGYNGTNHYAMANNGGTSSAPSAIKVTVEDDKLTGTIDDKIKWSISGDASNGYTFHPINSESWLYCIGSNNGVRVGTGEAKLFTIKDKYLYNTGQSCYIGIYSSQDWRRYTTINSNITGQSFAFYKKMKVTPITLSAACNDGNNFYVTYSNSNAFKVPADLTVSEIEVINGKLSVTSYETGDVVPANTGVLIAAKEAGEHNIELTTGGTSKLGERNMLKGSGDADMTASDMESTSASGAKFYRLTMHNGTKIGFWWGAEDGKAFSLAANKAYLAVPGNAGVRGFSFDDAETTEIDTVEAKAQRTENVVYNLAGQRVTQPARGLYIVNGRKVVMK